MPTTGLTIERQFTMRQAALNGAGAPNAFWRLFPWWWRWAKLAKTMHCIDGNKYSESFGH
tara:strand:+ start:1027 stop:1206 length:180 start_codon:yes stop_codon:yes gene_type:complete